ncbi:helix-turn-helix domain-containing protein [Ekhidna sp.]|uniref:TetR/AcrR family transcriptional regulator n=1 Tax=Ekhidna sp. TaxID=2608089 RepID=UPI0032ED29C2
MTEKQEKILNAALTLFAEEGYRSTSTSKVAKSAGVSEGLIFRHFGNKEGLLEAIIKLGEERAKELFADIVLEPDPKELLRKYIELFVLVSKDKDAIDFWKLQFKIKWELEIYGEHKMEAIEEALIQAFSRLRYNHPEQEANLLLTLMDGLATRFILQEQFEMEETIEFLKQKYKL